MLVLLAYLIIVLIIIINTFVKESKVIYASKNLQKSSLNDMRERAPQKYTYWVFYFSECDLFIKTVSVIYILYAAIIITAWWYGQSAPVRRYINNMSKEMRSKERKVLLNKWF